MRNVVQECEFLRLDGRKKAPMFRQLYEQLRMAILEGRLKANDRLPSSRELMKRLDVSRTTIVTALEMLIAEGYLATRHGRGTFVASEVPEATELPKLEGDAPTGGEADASIPFSQFGQRASDGVEFGWHASRPQPLCPGEPALDQFPIDAWSRIMRRAWKSVTPDEISYGNPAGHDSLREQIAEYLRVHRGVRCETEQVMIVNGTQQAIDVVARLVLNRGDKVLFENPGYFSARRTFENYGAQVTAIPVDELGANLRALPKRKQRAKLVYVTPSHQFPLGVTMSIERRLELIEWANTNHGLILEDDYDSEYRYGQRPLPCMQGIRHNARTIYVGSLSKVVCPGLGIGYAIVPTNMTTAFENALRLVSRPPSRIDQIGLSHFIRSGDFVRHLRRMRKIHGQRRECLVEAWEKRLSQSIPLFGNSAGLHCAAIFKNQQLCDREFVNELAQKGIIARALSAYFCRETPNSELTRGLVLGFASSTPHEIRRAVRHAHEVHDQLRPS